MAAGDTMTFVINDASTGTANPAVQVTITENGDGTLSFHLEQLVTAGAYLGDLRGFFFDLPNGQEGALAGAVATDQVKNPYGEGSGTAVQNNTAVIGNDSVMSAGGASNNLNGLTSGGDGYDFGLAIGTEGIGATGDDVRSFDFTLDATAALTLASLANATFGVRITSVGQDTNGDGTIDTARTASAKINETTFDPHFLVADDDAVCVDEGQVGSVGNVLTNDDDATKTDLDLVKVTYKNVDYSFDNDDTTNDFVVINLDSGGSVKIWQNGDYLVDASAADVAVETLDDISYTVQKTFYETSGAVAGTSTETATLTVDICPVDGPPGGGGPPPEGPPPASIAKSPGFWSTHNGDGTPPPDTVSEWESVATNQSFETYFGVAGPYSGQWDIVSPIDGSAGLVADITFSDALTLANGDNSENLLAKEATTAVLNYNETSLAGIHDSFVDWYVYERAHYDDTHAGAPEADLSSLSDAQILQDLKDQVQDAYLYNGGLNGDGEQTYTIAEMADLLKATHEV